MSLVALPCKSEHAKGEEGEIASLEMEEFSERRIVAPGLVPVRPGRNDERDRSIEMVLPTHHLIKVCALLGIAMKAVILSRGLISLPHFARFPHPPTCLPALCSMHPPRIASSLCPLQPRSRPKMVS
jgi:hypothetical protein